MASLKSMCVFLHALIFISFLSLHFAEGLRKITISQEPNRVLMGLPSTSVHYSSTPTFYNAFEDPAFLNAQNNAHKNPNFNDNPKDNTNFNADTKDNTNFNANPKDNLPNSENYHFNYQDNTNINGFKASLNDNNNNNKDAFFTNTYNSKETLPMSTNDYKEKEEHYSKPSMYGFSAQSSTSPSSLYGRKFPSSFEESFPNKQIYGKQSSPSTEQQSLYRSPSDEKFPASFEASFPYKQSSPSRQQETLYGGSPSFEASFPNKQSYGRQSNPSTSEQQSLYSSPSDEKFPAYFEASSFPKKEGYGKQSSSSSEKESLYSSSSNEKSFKYPSSYFFPKNSQAVSNYDSFFNTPTIHSNVPTTTSPLGRPTFPLSDHDLTYGHVQVP